MVEYTGRRVGHKTEKGELGPDCKGLALNIVLRSLDLIVERLENQRRLFYAHPYLDRIV